MVLSRLCSHHVPDASIPEHSLVCHNDGGSAPRAERCKRGSWCRCQHVASGKRLPWLMPPFLQCFPARLCGRAGRRASTPAAPDLPPSSFALGLEKPAPTRCAFCCATGGPGTAALAASSSHGSCVLFLPCLFEEGGAGQARRPFNFSPRFLALPQEGLTRSRRINSSSILRCRSISSVPPVQPERWSGARKSLAVPCPPWDMAPEQLLFAAPGSCRYLWILKLLLPAAKGGFRTLGVRLASAGGTGRAPRWLPAWLPLPAATVLVPVCQAAEQGESL